MNKLVISLGSNSPDRQSQMEYAIRHLKSKFLNVMVSSVYETLATNGKDAPYFNAVMIAETSLEINDATLFLKQWEMLCGRTLESKYQGVIPIDLDIVMWNDDIIKPNDYSYPYFTLGYNQLLEVK